MCRPGELWPLGLWPGTQPFSRGGCEMSMDERGVWVAIPAHQARGGLGPHVGSVSPRSDAAPQNPASGNFVAAALGSPDSQNVRNTDSSDTEVSRNLADCNVLTPSSCRELEPCPALGEGWMRQRGSLTQDTRVVSGSQDAQKPLLCFRPSHSARHESGSTGSQQLRKPGSASWKGPGTSALSALSPRIAPPPPQDTPAGIRPPAQSVSDLQRPTLQALNPPA